MRPGPATLALLTLLAASAARADWQTRSWSEWRLEERGAVVVFGIESVELARLGFADDAALRAAVRGRLALADAGLDCPLREITPAPAGATLLLTRLQFDCAGPLAAPELRVLPLTDAGSPLHYATVWLADGQRRELLFTRDEVRRVVALAPVPAGSPRVFARYLGHGFEHILIGLDHVAFLLCMLLAARPLGQRLWMITGFTLGHSLTLSLSVLGLLRVQTAAVEALIGFTVALLAAEVFQRAQRSLAAGVLLALVLGAVALATRGEGQLPALTLAALLVLTIAYLALVSRRAEPARLHLGMTAVFGLVHGLGFAAVLTALGLPAAQRGWALAGFNIGVELGQVLLLLVFAAAMGFAERFAGQARERLAEHALAGGLCALGVFWFVERAL